MRLIHRAALPSLRAASRAALACAFGATLLLAGTAARAQNDDQSADTFDQKIIGGLLEGLGLKRDGNGIRYQERAPLVIPPSRDLPPPEKTDAVLANNPAWPKDPDVMRRKAQEQLARSRNITLEREIEQNQLRPDQMTPGGNPRTPPRRTRTDTANGSPNGGGDLLSPSQLGYSGNLFSGMFGSSDNEVAKFTGEPPRTALTEPPPGYRTPSPDQPYGGGRAAAPKADDYSKHSDPVR